MAPSSTPPPLPPSVEEAYRRKCVLLKQRTAEVEETNDAARVRLARLKRQVEKQRLERAFLLEQLAKRTSVNVEDSDGSPSPPPTPKDKPLRTKRGHRKSSVAGGSGEAGAPAVEGRSSGGATFISQNVQTVLSPTPSLDNADHLTAQSGRDTRDDKSAKGKSDKDKGNMAAGKGANDAASGVGGAGVTSATSALATGSASDTLLKRPRNAFELYCAEMRPVLVERKQMAKANGEDEGGDDIDMADSGAGVAGEDDEDESVVVVKLARGWTDLDQSAKDAFEARAADEQAKYKKARKEMRQQKQDAEEEEGSAGKNGKDSKGGKKTNTKAETSEKEVKLDTEDKKAELPPKTAAADGAAAKDGVTEAGEDTEMADADTSAGGKNA